jgi:hypothetical protein
MPYLSGVLTGIVVTILVAYVIDHVGSQADTADLVNWNVVAQKIGAATEEVRQDVHEATAPEQAATPDSTSPDTTPPASQPAPQTP